jgi:hypothetical protein
MARFERLLHRPRSRSMGRRLDDAEPSTAATLRLAYDLKRKC